MRAEGLFLADSSIWIWTLGTRQIRQITSRVDDLLSRECLATTPIIRLEVLAGVRPGTEFTTLRIRFNGLSNLEPTTQTWDAAENLTFLLRRGGLSLPPNDVLIATVALEHGATLIHADQHFDEIANYTDLKVESYVGQVKDYLRRQSRRR